MGLIGTVINLLNWVAALLLLLAYLVPFVPPSRFPTLSLLSLAVSPLILINALFCLYWVFRMSRRVWLSATVLALGFALFGSLYQFGAGQPVNTHPRELTIMSYNVRLFNAYEDGAAMREDAEAQFRELVERHQPDVLCVQEFYKDSEFPKSIYPYQYIHRTGNRALGHAILSRLPIVGTGSFDFPDTYNNAIYADLVLGLDTLRVYNLHLQSMGIEPTVDYLQTHDNERTRRQISNAFVRQQHQLEKVVEHMDVSPYPFAVGADLNNTPFSYVYRQLNGRLTDAFRERGKGLGTTFRFEFYPIRIDFIFASPGMDVMDLRTIPETFSDHNPVMARLNLP